MPTFCQRGSSCSWGFGRCRSGELAVKFSFMGLSVPIPRPLLLFLCWRSLSSARSSGRSSHKPRYRLVSQKKYINPAAVTHRPNAIVASWKLSFISATITKESTLWYTELEKIGNDSAGASEETKEAMRCICDWCPWLHVVARTTQSSPNLTGLSLSPLLPLP